MSAWMPWKTAAGESVGACCEREVAIDEEDEERYVPRTEAPRARRESVMEWPIPRVAPLLGEESSGIRMQ